MSSTFLGIEMSRRGLQANRLALEVTGHNVANAGTEGYTRQEAVFIASAPLSYPVTGTIPGQVGTGVEVDRIRRIRNEYLDQQVWEASATHSYWQQNTETLLKVESAFPEPAAPGIQNALVDFYNNWQELNNTPQDPGLKSVIWESAGQLTTLFNQSFSQLKAIDETIAVYSDGILTGGSMQDMVSDINSLVGQVAELNTSIVRSINLGAEPNDLMDKRDLLLDRLSEYGPLNATIVTDGTKAGTVTLTFLGQDILKENNIPASLSVKILNDPGAPVSYLAGNTEAVLVFNAGTSTEKQVNLTTFDNGINKGALAGLESARQKNLSYIDMLNRLAVSIGDEINSLEPVKDTALTGSKDFFTYGSDPGKAALNFDLSALVKKDANQIDGTKALAVANTRYEKAADIGGVTFEQYYRQIMSGIGAGLEYSAQRVENQEAIREQLFNIRESAGGVNLDEELTRMVQYQHSHAAVAKVMSTMDEMLDLLINRLR